MNQNGRKGTLPPNTRMLHEGLLMCLTLLILCSNAVASSLTQTQLEQAGTLADKVSWPPGSVVRSNGHPLGIQNLSVEIQEQKKRHATKLIRVYQYHYDHQIARVLVFDLERGQLVREQFISTVHLPLNSQEIRFATVLLSQQGQLIEQLREEQRVRGQIAFQSINELEVKASIFEPADDSHPCHTERCVLMALFDGTRTVFSTEPVVYLQSRKVELLSR